MSKDYYADLGVSRSASESEISDAYRKLAKETHPDRNPGDESAVKKFKEVTEAFEVLSDPQKRRNFDTYGVSNNSTNRSSYGFNINPFDMFSHIFGDDGGHNFSNAPSRGADILQTLNISLAEAYTGIDKDLVLELQKNCTVCSGDGVKTWKECDLCFGAGQIERMQGPFRVCIRCNKCQGKCKLPVVVCDDCKGSGKVNDTPETQLISIPAGIEEGVQLRIRGKGHNGPSNMRGDLICTIHIEQHLLFERDGNDLYCTLPITYSQSIIGHETHLPLLNKTNCKLTVPPLIRSGSVLRMRGMGMPIIHKRDRTHGDLLVKIQIESPEKPNKEYLDLVKKLSGIDDKQEYVRIKDFLDRIEKLK